MNHRPPSALQAVDGPGCALLPAASGPGGEALGYILAAVAPATREAYRSDWACFSRWCSINGLDPLAAPAAAVATFIAGEASRGSKASSVARKIAAIRYAHRLAGLDPPTTAGVVVATMQGIRRTLGTAPEQKEAATADIVEAMAASTGAGMRGARDRGLLLLGFAGALRRSELAALEVRDLAFGRDGLRISIRRSKGDQEGAGQEVAVPNGRRLRPVDAVASWLEISGVREGAVFRRVSTADRVLPSGLTGESVALVVKRLAARSGLDPSAFAGHSLRSGFLTSAAEGGASVFKMMETSRHKDLKTLQGYVRRADVFKDHAGSSFL